MRSQKQAFAKDTDGEPNVLIDDYIKNIKEWEDKGWYWNTSYISSQNYKRFEVRLGFK